MPALPTPPLMKTITKANGFMETQKPRHFLSFCREMQSGGGEGGRMGEMERVEDGRRER